MRSARYLITISDRLTAVCPIHDEYSNPCQISGLGQSISTSVSRLDLYISRALSEECHQQVTTDTSPRLHVRPSKIEHTQARVYAVSMERSETA